MKILSLLFILSCSSITTREPDLYRPTINHELASQRSTLIGKWYGKSSVNDGGEREWLRELRVDGTFTIKFKVTDKNKQITEQLEAGYWGISPDIYFSLTREIHVGEVLSPLAVTNPTFYDAYTVLQLEPGYFKYQSKETGEVYETFKVAEDYKF